MMVDGPPVFHLCPRQEKGERRMAKDAAAMSTSALLGSSPGSLTLEQSLLFHH